MTESFAVGRKSFRLTEYKSNGSRGRTKSKWQPGTNALRLIVLSLGAFVIGLFSGCGKPDSAERYVRPEQVLDFATLFGKNCSGCHGMDGRLGPAPPLNDPLFQAIISDAQISELIHHGRDGHAMPPFAITEGGSLTDAQIQIVIDGIRKQWKKPLPADGPQPPVYQVTHDDPAGVRQGDINAGEQLFSTVCLKCHGAEARDAAGPSGDTPGILQHAFGALVSDQFIRRIIITGRPDLDMPDYIELGNQSDLKRPLTEQEIIDLAAYVRSAQGVPKTVPQRVGL